MVEQKLLEENLRQLGEVKFAEDTIKEERFAIQRTLADAGLIVELKDLDMRISVVAD